jgi:hypothetical protein
LKIEFWTQGLSSLDATFYFQSITLQFEIKKHGEGRERRIITHLGDMLWDEAA